MNYFGKRVIILLATPLLLWAPAFGILNNIKDTYDILNEDYKHFSLVHGAILWEIGVIRRLYDFGQIFPEYKEENGRKLILKYINLENTHKTVQLIHALFYRVPGSTSESDFSETKLLKIKDASAISQKVAEILALIRTLRKQNIKVKDILGTAKTLAQEQLDDVNTKLQDLDKKLEPVPKKQWGPILKAASDDETKWVKERSELRKNIGFIATFQQEPTVEQNYKNLGKAIDNSGPITELYKNLEQLQRLFTDLLAQSPLDLTKPSIAQVAFDAINESDLTNVDALYPEHMPEMILLAFVYKRCSEDRSALKALYEKLNELFRLKVLKQELTEAWVKDRFDAIGQDAALTNLQAIFDLGEQEVINKMDAVLYYALQVRSMPAPVGYAKATYEYELGKKTASFPDCMCNTMRNLINALAYDAKNNNFDLAVLKKRLERVSDQFDEKLEKFFKDFSSIAKASSPSAHDAWAGVISNIPYVAYVRSSGSVGEVKGLGYISIPKDDLTNTALVNFLQEKGYQVLPDNQYGYELMPSVRNVIVVLNHLLQLNLFENGLINDFTNVEFIKTYFPKLCQGLKVKLGYQALIKDASKQDEQTDFDKRDFEPVKIYSTIIFQSPSYGCELMTRNLNHGELYLRGAAGKEEAKMVELLQNYASEIQNISFSYMFTNLFSRPYVSLRHLEAYSPQVISCNLFAVPLENTGFLEEIIVKTSSMIITKKTSLKIKLGVTELLLRLAENQPDERVMLSNKINVFKKFLDQLNKTELLECKKNKIFEWTENIAADALEKYTSLRAQTLELFDALFKKGYGFDKAAEAAKKAVESANSNKHYAGINLFESLVEAGYAFDKATDTATQAIESKDDLVQQRAIRIFSALVKKDWAFAQAERAAVKAVVGGNDHIKSKGLELLQLLVEKGHAFDKAVDTAAKAIESDHGDYDLVRTSGIKLFKTLFEKAQAFDVAANAAVKAVESNDRYIERDGKELFNILFEKGQIFGTIANTAAKAVNSKNESVQKLGLEYFKKLFKNNEAFQMAADVASEALESKYGTIRYSGEKLFYLLIEKGQAFGAATDAAIKAVNVNDYAQQMRGFRILKALVEKDQAFEQATNAISTAINADNPLMEGGFEHPKIELLIALVKRGQAFKEATNFAAKESNWDFGGAWIKLLLEALLEKDQAFDVATNVAEKLYGLKIFNILVEKGHAFDEAKKAAKNATQSFYINDILNGLELFEKLIEQNQAFNEASQAAREAASSKNQSMQELALKIFKMLVEKGQAFDNATIAAGRAVTSENQAIQILGLELTLKLGQKELEAASKRKAEALNQYQALSDLKILVKKGQALDKAAEAAVRAMESSYSEVRESALGLIKILKTKAPEKTQAAIQKLLPLSTINDDTKEELHAINEFIGRKKSNLLQEKLTTLKLSLAKLKEKLETLRSSLTNLKMALAKS